MALPRFLHHADEDVFEREAIFAGAQHVDSTCFQTLGCRADSTLSILISNHVQAISKERDAPTLRVSLEKIRGTLRLVYDEFQHVSFLRDLDLGWTTFSHHLTGGHKTEPVALL